MEFSRAYLPIGLVLIAFIGASLYESYHNDTIGTSLQASATTSMNTDSSPFSLSSTAFTDGATIPAKYTCDGESVSPALSISGVPEGTVSLALIVDDPDVPKQLKPDGVFDHWVLFDIPPATKEIPEDGSAGTAGVNGAGADAYAAPCPPPQYEPSEHRYVFTLYALDATLGLPAGASKSDVLFAMKGHVIAQTELIGRYKRGQ